MPTKPPNVRRPTGTDSAGEHDDPIVLAAELLARAGPPDAGAALVREHVPDRSGRCHGCPHAATPASLHPCRLRLIGEKLVQMRRS